MGWMEKTREEKGRSQRHRRKGLLSNKPRFSQASGASLRCVLALAGALPCALTWVSGWRPCGRAWPSIWPEWVTQSF